MKNNMCMSNVDINLLNSVLEIAVNSTNDTKSIMEIFELISNALGIDRIYIYQQSPDKTCLHKTFEYVHSSCAYIPETSKRLFYSQKGNFWDFYDSDGIFYCADMASIPSLLADQYTANNVHAVMQYAFHRSSTGAYEGFIGFAQHEALACILEENKLFIHCLLRVIELIVSFSANDSIYRYEKMLIQEKFAYYDSMLDIKNRTCFAKDFASICRYTDDSIVPIPHGFVLCFDIIGFKYINTNFGHECGNMFLRAIVQFLCTIVSPDCIYRAGGNRFLLLLNESDEKTMQKVMEKIRSRFKKRWYVCDSSLECQVRSCVLGYPGSAHSVDDVFRFVEFMLASAKQFSQQKILVLDGNEGKKIQQNIVIMKILKNALFYGAVSVWYQPIFDVQKNAFTKAEALARLQTPEGDYISPMDFIPIAEQTGVIRQIGLFVLEEACKKITHMLRKGIDFDCVTVNVSTTQFLQDDFCKTIKKLLDAYKIPPSKLKLEVTESVLIASFERIRSVMMQLVKVGVQFALDDFGTGYSSLSYLLELPINTVKIDRSFIVQISNSNKPDDLNKIMLSNIIRMVLDLKMNIIAEGIETEQQFNMLTEMGCTLIQGYYVSRPVPEIEIEKCFLKKYVLEEV